jgi:antitoxin VapB
MASSVPQVPPRRRQRAITIRSDHALARLALLARDGRSQVEIIEEALDRMPLPGQGDRQTFLRDIAAIQERVPQGALPPMAELDAAQYDDNGLPK